MGILETKVRERNFNRLASSMMLGWASLANYGSDPSGPIWVLWNPASVSVSLVGSSYQVLHCLVKVLSTSMEFLVSFTYVSNFSEERHLPWHDLRHFNTSGNPWVLLGDFNIIRSSGDKSGGSILPFNDMDEYNACLSTMGLDYIPYIGQHFTWCNQGLMRLAFTVSSIVFWLMMLGLRGLGPSRPIFTLQGFMSIHRVFY